VRVLGVDALVVGSVAPQLVPVPAADADRLAVLAPATAFLNASAQALLPADRVSLQAGLALRAVQVAGTSAAVGGPLLVMDIAAAQDLFGRDGQLSRIDVRLRPGVRRAAWLQALRLPASVQAAEPADAGQRVSQLSRAYRVNLTVLALVALFTGAFLVFSVLALSVARRAQQFALLGVLGLTARQRLQLVLAESAVLGVVGSVAGIGVGTALAAAALSLLGGDLGGGYFSGVQPQLEWQPFAAAAYGGLGVVAAMAGGWLPARGCRWRRRSRASARACRVRATTRSAGRRSPPRCCSPCCRRWRAFRWPRTLRSASCWWAASRCCPPRSARCTTASRPRWPTACCRCWRWSVRAACVKAPRSP
jgi:putative ABC transport system permease protein